MLTKIIMNFSCCLLLLSSCAITELEIAKAPSTSSWTSVRAKSGLEGMSREDSLRLVYEIQTDREGFLVRHIGQDNGEWKIRISRENALTLGIGVETYDFYQEYVSRLNRQ